MNILPVHFRGALISVAAVLPFLFCTTVSSAQESDPFSYAHRISPSSESYSMSQYGKIAPKTNTGAMTYSFPIYTYRDEDFNIPITLEYYYDGFKPDIHSGTVGLGWHLNCGGIITRQVVGLPDDYIDQNCSPKLYGYYYVFTDSIPPQGEIGQYNEKLADSLKSRSFYTDKHVTAGAHPSSLTSLCLSGFLGSMGLISNSPISYIASSSGTEELFDCSSDLYHFSIPGASGDFIIQADGTTKIFNATVPEGEISVNVLFRPMTDAYSYTEIVIRTGDGFVYCFGSKGDVAFHKGVNYIDYSFEAPRVGIVQENEPNTLCFSALHLRTIHAPNGREVLFGRSSLPCFEMFYLDSVQAPVYNYYSQADGGEHQGTSPRIYSSLKATFHRPLEYLCIDGDTLISFNYQVKDYREFPLSSFLSVDSTLYANSLSCVKVDGATPPNNWFINERCLSSVIVRNKNRHIIDSVSLHHCYSSATPGHSSKMFLESVTSSRGLTSFSYDHSSLVDEYPPVDALDKDHWGYWRGSYGSYYFYSTHHQQSSLYDLSSGLKDSDSTHTSYAALRRINYPTGGYTEIDYECNSVDKLIDIASDSPDSYRIIDSAGFRGGGMRVKRICNKTGGVGSFNSVYEYDYCNSGILLKMPRYYLQILAYFEMGGTIVEPRSGASFTGDGWYQLSVLNNHGLSVFGQGHHLHYSKVRVKYPDRSFKDIVYPDYGLYPDSYAHDLALDSLIVIDKILRAWTEFDSSRRYFFFGGLPIGHDTTLIKENIQLSNILLTDYDCIRTRPKTESYYRADSLLVMQKEYVWHADLSIKATGLYNIFSDFLVARRSFVQPRLDSVITTEYLPGGGSLSDTTRYTYNDLGQQTVVEKRGFDGDIRRSRFSYEHESDATAPPANIAAVATSRLYVDGNNRSEYLTSLRHIEYETDSALRHLPILSQEFCSKAPRFPVVNDGGIEWFAPKSTDDTLARRLSYNAMQRPALLSLPGGAYVAFTWDASGRYPLSREENGPAMKSYYAWKDMVGLTQLKNPTGRSEWYGYDEKNRLSEVYRADSVLVREYDYHIYSEDTTLGPSSIKQTIWRTANKNNREIAYYDGLGYPIQKVRTSTQTTGGHIVTPIAYDALRRDDAKVYLPYGANYATYDSAAFRKQQHHYRGYGKDSLYAYTGKEYGTSPAGRLLSVRKPGKAYADSAKKVVYEYRTNIATDSVLNMYATVDTLPKLKVGSGYLPAGKLLLTKTTDEDECTSEVFTNSAGKTILSRQRTGGQRLDTYFVYDLRDSLVCVLQPEGSASILLGSSHPLLPPIAQNDTITIATIDDALLDNYAFLYSWDSQGRLSAKKRPGAAAEEFLPDDRGRVVLSRDGNLRNQGKWLYSEYDEYDALLRKSLITVNLGLDTLRQAARGQVDSIFTYPDTILMWPYYYRQDPEIFYYGRTASLAAGDSLFTPELDYIGDVESAGNDPSFGHYIVFEMERYYVGSSRDSIATGPVDTMVTNWPAILANAVTNSTLLEEHRYDRGDSPGIPQALDFMSVTGIVTAADTSSTRNLEVWQRQLMLPPGRTVPGDTLRYVERAFYYDTPGNTVQTVERNALGGISRTSAKYDYLGNVIVSEEKHAVSGNNTPTVKRSSLTYDSLGRIASEDVTVNGTATGTLFDYDLMGRQTYAGWSASRAEMVEIMSYDICGRLTDKETFRTWNEAGEEEAERGRWSITGVATTLDTAQAVIPLGNRNGDDGEEQEPEEPDLPADQLVFKQHLKYFNPTEQSSQPRWNGLISEIAHQRTDTGTVITNGYFYDHAGRLTDHIRYDGNSQTSRYTERDLSFDRNGNILTLKRYGTNVAAPQDNLTYTYEGNKLMQLNGATYQYDSNGNMTHDGRRGLDLSWNHLNLPSSICSDEDEDALVNYTYLTDGTKVITQQPATGEGYAYLGSATYKLVNNVWTLESVPFTGGRFIANATGGMDEYRYITDHLGSTRVIVTGTDYHEVEHNDYYPFGKRISDNTLPTTQNNRWRFSGKEIQTLGNLGLLDFGARLYDEDAVKWKSQDPMADSYSWLSPYGYCAGNPIALIDPFGTSPIYSPDGSFLGTDDQGLQGDFIIMDKSLFEQGMAHDEAMTNQWKETISESIMSAIQAHYAYLPQRPDYDGFVTVSEGIAWAKSHVGAKKNPTPDNVLYIDVAKIDFGFLSVYNRHFKKESSPLINLYWLVNPLSINSINSTYALGSTRIRLLDAETGAVKLLEDTYDWDYHHKISFRYPYPRGIRDNLIFLERIRTGINNRHGFRLEFYGIGTIKH